MRTTASVLAHAQTTVEPDESWRDHNQAGYPFQVRVLFYTGGDDVTCRGWAIRTDGSQGFIERTRLRKLSELPGDHARLITEAYRSAFEAGLERCVTL